MPKLRHLFAVSLIAAAASAETLPQLMSRIDTGAAEFRGMTARIKKHQHTAVIDDDSTESGVISMRRGKGSDVQVRIDFTEPEAKSWAFANRKAEVYYPKIQTVQEYDLGKQGKLLDQFVLLGFGSNSKELAKNYDMKLLGDDAIAGQKTTRLELIPKSEQAREHLKKVEIWFPDNTPYPLQQKFFQASGDYTVVSYAELKLQPNLPDSAVRLILPKGVKREFPQR
jgi:outer membrane lipoprotein-sorting protein